MRKEERAITLIALVTAVIILAILATVSVRVAMNIGIIDHGINATDNFKKNVENYEEQREKITNYIESKIPVLNKPATAVELTVAEISTPVDGSAYDLGEEIYIKATIENKGNTILTNVEIECELTGDTWGVGTFKPGDKEDLDLSYTCVEYDIVNGEIEIEVTGYGIDEENNEIEFEPGVITCNIKPSNYSLKIDVINQSTPANGSYYTQGETIRSIIRITNNGNRTLSDIEYEICGDSLSYSSLSPLNQVEYGFVYEVIQQDVQQGNVTLDVTATAIGYDIDGNEVEAVVDPVTVNYPTRKLIIN